MLISCEHREKNEKLDDLNVIKKDFLLSIMQQEVDESPFQMNYTLKTIFFSKDIISLLGEMNVYDHLPHGWDRYEGKTFCKVDGNFKETKLWDLFTTTGQREFLRKYCENSLKSQSTSYFSGMSPLRTRLEYEDMRTFVIDDKFLIVFFQPYTVGGLGDGPWQVKISYEHLKNQWNSSNSLALLLPQILSSQSYTASWDQESYAQIDAGKL